MQIHTNISIAQPPEKGVRLPFQRGVVGRDLEEQRVADRAVDGDDGNEVAFAERGEFFPRNAACDDRVRRGDAFGRAVQQHDAEPVRAGEGEQLCQEIEERRLFGHGEPARRVDGDQPPFARSAHVLREGVGAVVQHVDYLPDLFLRLFADLLVLPVVQDVGDRRLAYARGVGDVLYRNFFAHGHIIGSFRGFVNNSGVSCHA